MASRSGHSDKSIAKVFSAAYCKVALSIVFSSVALPCFSQVSKMDQLFQVPGSMYPEVLLRWTLKGGCFYYRTIRADFISDLSRFKQTYQWSGECIAGQPLNGPGELLGLSVNFKDEYVPDATPMIGRMINGRWDGPTRKGNNSYTYRNGCISENLCRTLFNQLDTSLSIKSTNTSITEGSAANSTVVSTNTQTGTTNSVSSVKFAKDGRPTGGVKSFGIK